MVTYNEYNRMRAKKDLFPNVVAKLVESDETVNLKYIIFWKLVVKQVAWCYSSVIFQYM